MVLHEQAAKNEAGWEPPFLQIRTVFLLCENLLDPRVILSEHFSFLLLGENAEAVQKGVVSHRSLK